MSEENTSTYENIEEENSIGHVQIAGEVIAIIAGLAATEVDGVSRLAGSLSNELASRLGKKNPAKGVKVELLPPPCSACSTSAISSTFASSAEYLLSGRSILRKFSAVESFGSGLWIYMLLSRS